MAAQSFRPLLPLIALLLLGAELTHGWRPPPWPRALSRHRARQDAPSSTTPDIRRMYHRHLHLQGEQPDWDKLVASYYHRSLEEEDTLPLNLYSDAMPDLPGVEAHLQVREARATAGRRARVGHHVVPAMPRRFYVQLRASDLTALAVPPQIALVVAKQLKVTPHAPVSVPLWNSEFCEYAIQLEWLHGAMYFMRGWHKYANMTKLWEKDIVVFELENGSFTVTIIRATTSCQPYMKCPRHGMTVSP